MKIQPDTIVFAIKCETCHGTGFALNLDGERYHGEPLCGCCYGQGFYPYTSEELAHQMEVWEDEETWVWEDTAIDVWKD